MYGYGRVRVRVHVNVRVVHVRTYVTQIYMRYNIKQERMLYPIRLSSLEAVSRLEA